MKQGTVSILLGCHSPIHSILVLISWKIIYGSYPKLWEFICIFIHDFGHIGLDYLDSEKEKLNHWKRGAWLAGFLFGQKGYNLVAGHSSHSGHTLSPLYKPDKYAWHIAPKIWLYSNTIFEPKLRMGYTRWEAVILFKKQVKESIESGAYRSTHEIYKKRCK